MLSQTFCHTFPHVRLHCWRRPSVPAYSFLGQDLLWNGVLVRILRELPGVTVNV